MKNFHVFMYHVPLAPLDPERKLHPARVMEFDDETTATDVARTQRNKWDTVSVYKKGSEEALVTFHGNDMYVGTKRTRLPAEEAT